MRRRRKREKIQKENEGASTLPLTRVTDRPKKGQIKLPKRPRFLLRLHGKCMYANMHSAPPSIISSYFPCISAEEIAEDEVQTPMLPQNKNEFIHHLHILRLCSLLVVSLVFYELGGCTVSVLGRSELHLDQLPLNQFASACTLRQWCIFLPTVHLCNSSPSYSWHELTHLYGREGGDDGGRAEAVRDEAEVGEVPLYRGVEYLRGPRVAQRRAVLVQQVHQLFRNYSAKRRKTLMNHESRTDGRNDQKFFFCPPLRCDYAVPNWALLSLHFWLCKQAFTLGRLVLDISQIGLVDSPKGQDFTLHIHATLQVIKNIRSRGKAV